MPDPAARSPLIGHIYVAMPRKPVTRALYDALLAAFREKPGVWKSAGKRALCDPRTAQRAWEVGWPEKDLPPISRVIEAENEKTRAELRRRELEAQAAIEKADAETRSLAVEQALAARAEVGEVLKGARAIALGTLAAVARLTPGVIILADRIKTDLTALAADPHQVTKLDGEGNALEVKRYTTKELMGLADYYMRFSGDLTRQAQRIVQMERLYLGLPTEIVGVSDMTLEEALAEIDEAKSMADTARQQGLFALEGGKARNTPPAAAAAP